MKSSPLSKNNCLTELEVYGLSAPYNLADGHSYLSASQYFNSVVSALPALWEAAEKTPVPEMELLFKDKFSDYFGLQGLKNNTLFSVCPTASNSIDIVGAWAREMNYTVGLVEPIFDNLAQLLRRREVRLTPVAEAAFANIECLREAIAEQKLDVLFMVNPNNPTGTVISESMMSAIMDVCVAHGVVVVLDTSFRFCNSTTIDEYQMLLDKKASFIILEDTGKQWPSLDTKVSLLSYSLDVAPTVRSIYEELYLCSSNFSLRILIEFIDATQAKGGISYIQSLVKSNVTYACEALSTTQIALESPSHASIMSVVWLNIERTGLDDLSLTAYLATYGVAVLPGRYFYWNSHHSAGHHYVRIAVLKPDHLFKHSIIQLKKALDDLAASQKSKVEASLQLAYA